MSAPPPPSTTGSGSGSPVTMRLLAGMALGAAIATAAALFLGEYEFDGWLPYVAGLLLGLVVAEAVVSVSRQQSDAAGLFSAAASALAMLLAGFIDANGQEPIKVGAYLAAVIAAAAAAGRGRRWRS